MCLNLYTKLFKEVLYGVCKVGPSTSRVCTQPFIDFLEITAQHCSSKKCFNLWNSVGFIQKGCKSDFY